MTKTKLRPRYEMKNVPEQAIKDLRDYAEDRGIDRGEAFAEAVSSLGRDKMSIERANEIVKSLLEPISGIPFIKDLQHRDPELFERLKCALEKKEG